MAFQGCLSNIKMLGYRTYYKTIIRFKYFPSLPNNLYILDKFMYIINRNVCQFLPVFFF